MEPELAVLGADQTRSKNLQPQHFSAAAAAAGGQYVVCLHML